MKNGFLKRIFRCSGKSWSKVQLLLESMVVMLSMIAESYGKYIKIQDNQLIKEGGQPSC